MQGLFSKQSLVEAGLTGAIYLGGEKVISGVDFMHKGFGRFGESAVISMISDPLSDVISPKLLSVANDAKYGDYLRYVVSGGLFVLSDSFLKQSDESMLYKFLLQTGSQTVACYLRPALVK
jgi:hypothetical protein